MSYEQANTACEHSLRLDGRSKMSVTGVLDVSGFDENTVILSTSQGELNIYGESLHIDRIDLEAGQLLLSGQVRELRYDEAPAAHSLWSRLFG